MFGENEIQDRNWFHPIYWYRLNVNHLSVTSIENLAHSCTGGQQNIKFVLIKKYYGFSQPQLSNQLLNSPAIIEIISIIVSRREKTSFLVTSRTMTSQIICLTIVYSTVYSDTDQRKHESPASLAFVRGIRRWPVNSPHKGPVTRKTFSFDDVVMTICIQHLKHTTVSSTYIFPRFDRYLREPANMMASSRLSSDIDMEGLIYVDMSLWLIFGIYQC